MSAVGKQNLENEASKPIAKAGMKTHAGERPQLSGRRFVLALLSAMLIALALMATVANDLWAAIELAYYRAAATNNAVFLEWATVREVNINGFEIMCKRINEPDIAYHPIGSRIALGSPTTGSTYNFNVTSGLIPGERYCFRLREITTDNTPGEAFDLCGYGLGLTPPPTAVTVQVSIPVTLTPTIVAVEQVPGLTPPPTLAPTIDPFATATPTIDPFATATPTVDPFAPPTPTTDPFATPTFTPSPTVTVVGQGQSPLPTPMLTPTGTVTTSALAPGPDTSAAQLPVTEMPPEEPTPTATETATEMPTEFPTEAPTATATLTTTVPVTIEQEGGAPLAVDPNGAPAIPDNGAAAAAEATPTPLYVVVTATPTPEAAVVVAPTFTPWPTAVPTETFALTNLLVPNTQNLMVGLLCLIFLSASGLGALGLVTSVLYMRSQTRRDGRGDRLPGPVYERRRY